MGHTVEEFVDGIMRCFYLDGDTLDEKLASSGRLFGRDYERKLRAALSEAGVDQLGLDSTPGAQKTAS